MKKQEKWVVSVNGFIGNLTVCDSRVEAVRVLEEIAPFEPTARERIALFLEERVDRIVALGADYTRWGWINSARVA